jgi:4-amino-4-deoxy-L-arabinose transferase-like glycosyltransferase
MKPRSPRLDSCRSREVLVVFIFTLVGAILRLWSVSRLGLLHFDEGIYAASGLWIFSRNGILDVDPLVIAYAPPGFPFFVGLSYFALGAGDLSAILVSIVSGTLTIPAVASLARRTFGSGAGGVAAAFAAISGSLIAFSRLALTDASYLLFWVLASIAGQRFLERPGALRAVVLGLAVGAAQLFKYNGWLAGAAVMLAAAIWPIFHPALRRSRLAAATWGWGLLAALVAAVAYGPWFAFVESHGGYGALLAHQRGYLGGFASWPGHLAVQLAQARALSGGAVWLASAGLAAGAAVLFIGFDSADRRRMSLPILMVTLVLAVLRVTPDLAWWVPMLWLPCFFSARKIAPSSSLILIYAGWLILLLLTPFYHPYARLWLPLHAFECVFLAGVVGVVHAGLEEAARRRPVAKTSTSIRPGKIDWFASLAAMAVVIHAAIYFTLTHPWKRERPGLLARSSALPGLLAPSDSLRSATALLGRDLPKTVKTLRVFARPPVTFYLGQMAGPPVERQASLTELLRPGDQGTWALLDTALLTQGDDRGVKLNQSSTDWNLARAIPTPLSLPVWLDIDPAVAFGDDDAGASFELRLLRPERAGDPQ